MSKSARFTCLLGFLCLILVCRAQAFSQDKPATVHWPDGYDYPAAILEENEPVEEFCDETYQSVLESQPNSLYGLALANLTLGLLDETPFNIMMAKAFFKADAEVARDPREKEFSSFGAKYTDAILSGKFSHGTDTHDRMEEIQPKKYPLASTGFRTIVIGKTAIHVNKDTKIKTQVDRVVRDWLQAKNVTTPPWGYSPDKLVQSHEGKKISELVALTDASVVPVWGTKAEKFGESWYAPDAEGVFRFEISEDKVYNFPSTIPIDDHTAILNDTHGISAIAWNSLDANLVIGCGDHKGKIEAAYYLADRGVNVYVPTDRFLSMLIGTRTKGLVIGSAPVKKTADGAEIGDQPISIDINEPIVVSTTKGHYPLQYYDTPNRYFQALQDYTGKRLNITAVEVTRYGHATNVVAKARKLHVKLLGIRVKSKEEHDAVYAWLKEDHSRRAVLFHSAVYPDGYKLFYEFPEQTSFGDIYPEFK